MIEEYDPLTCDNYNIIVPVNTDATELLQHRTQDARFGDTLEVTYFRQKFANTNIVGGGWYLVGIATCLSLTLILWKLFCKEEAFDNIVLFADSQSLAHFCTGKTTRK